MNKLVCLAFSICVVISLLCSAIANAGGGAGHPGVKALTVTAESETVYDLLDRMGPTVFDGQVTTLGEVMIKWQDDNPLFWKNGLPLLDQTVVYLDDQLILQGLIPATKTTASEDLRIIMSRSEDGNLIVRMSSWQGYNGSTMTMNDEGFLLNFVTCVCYGGTGKNITKRACLATECGDPNNCNTNPNGPAVYCENREPVADSLVPQIGQN